MEVPADSASWHHAPDKGSSRAAEKRNYKTQKGLVAEFSLQMSSSVKEMEDTIQNGDAAHKAKARDRRKVLKELLKAVADPGKSMEERMRLLQTKCVELVHAQSKHDQEMLALQAQLDAAHKEVAAGQAKAASSAQKVNSLQRLARTLQGENQAYAESLALRQKHIESFKATTESIQLQLSNHAAESEKVLGQNKVLTEENFKLRDKLKDMAELLDNTQKALDALRTTQTQQLQDLQDKVQQQAEFVSSYQELQQQLQATAEDKNKTALLESRLAQAMDAIKVGQQLQQDLVGQRKHTQLLLQERKLLNQQISILKDHVATLQQQLQDYAALKQSVNDQAEELKRKQLQKQRLEGLCRALQARCAAAEGMTGTTCNDLTSTTEPPKAGQHNHAAEDAAGSTGRCSSPLEGWIAVEHPSPVPAEEPAAVDVLDVCRLVVQKAVAAVVAQN